MLISLREASRDLRVNRVWLRGYCDGRGIALSEVGKSLCLSCVDVEVIREFLKRQRNNKSKVA